MWWGSWSSWRRGEGCGESSKGLTGVVQEGGVSRNGQVLLGVTRRLADASGIDLNLRYLYGGRTAWQHAAVALPNGWMNSTDG